MPSYGGVAAKTISGQSCKTEWALRMGFFAELPFKAHLIATLLASIANTASCTWLHRDAVAGLEVLHLAAN